MGCGRSESTTTSAAPVAANAESVRSAAFDTLKAPPDGRWTPLDDLLPGPVWSGDDDKGSVYGPLFRGGFPGLEDTIYTPADGDCTKSARATIRVDWDSAANTVHFLLKGKGFPVRPDIHRTEGVDWWPNPFHDAPKDIPNGAYRLWLILGSTTQQTPFYYDPQSLKLLGTKFDFATPPANAIPQTFPIFSTTGSNEFDPDATGNVRFEFTLQYNAVRNQNEHYARAWASFVPHDLCEALPLQPAASQLRPYVSPWQPADPAPVWRDMLHAGIGFSVQIDERVGMDNGYFGALPYVYSGVDFLSNLFALQGGVPRGSGMQILSAIQNVAPMTFPIPFGDGVGCRTYVQEPHVTAPRYCEGQQ